MRKVNFKNRVFLAGILLSVLSMVTVSCLRIFRVDAPDVVETNSVFEVRLVLDDLLEGEDPGDNGHPSHRHFKSWGFLGVQLPVGWTINAEELEYEFYPGEPWPDSGEHIAGEYHIGTFEYDEEYVDSCFANVYIEDGCYITGFSTIQAEYQCLDSIVVKIKIHTDGQVGDKYLAFYVQENGDEEDERFGDPITHKPYYPVDKGIYETKPKPAARNQDGDNGENATYYIGIRAIQGSGIEGVTVDKKDASCNVSALGNGQLLVNLLDSKKIGATAMVYNMKGQIVATQTLNQTANVISGLAQGVYSVAVQKDGVRSVKKVTVK
jgi:hypothetical protein